MRLIFLAGANSVHSYKWIRYFSDTGNKIVWISFEDNLFPQLDNVEYFRITKPKYGIKFIFHSFILRKTLRITNDDVFHVHSVGSYGLLGWILSWWITNKFIVTPWGSDLIFGSKNIVKKFIISKILNRANLITCDAVFIKNIVMKYIAGKDKIKIINFGIDTNIFRRINSQSNNKRNKTKGFTIISTRNFEPVYNVKSLILACKQLQDSGVDFHLKLIGAGSQETYLKDLVVELDLLSQVEFLGRVPNDQLVDVLCSSDVYVSTSLSDAGIAASTAEAMACQLPVIITDTAENGDWIIDGNNGYLFKPSDAQDLKNKLIEVKSTCSNTAIGENARKTIKENNDYRTEMRKMDELYRSFNSVSNK